MGLRRVARECALQMLYEMDVGKLDLVGKALKRTASLAPDPAWNSGSPSWSEIANSGAAAAAAGDEATAKQTCKSCHKAFRSKYKASFRSKAL